MEATVKYAGIDQEVSCEAGEHTLLQTSVDNKIPHLRECGGNGKCTTCRVRILEGDENLSPRTKKEKKVAEKRKWDNSIRLACQCTVQGDVKVQRLIWSSAEVNKIQKELVPEGEAEERAIAILFCDLRNFTKLSTQNTSFDIAYLLNRFYTVLGDPILLNNGVIYQYVGDEIVGVFGTAGGSKEKNCLDAIRAAKAMQYALERLNKTELKDFDVKLEIGIGVNFGKAYVGHLGHPTHRVFSVVGDPVNVASRIEGQTKRSKTKLLISDSVYANLDPELIKLGDSFYCSLNGIDDDVLVHELEGFKKMDLQLELQASLNYLLKDEQKFSMVFYSKVFNKAPFVKDLFLNNIVDQGRLLTHMLGSIVYSLSRPEYLKLGLKSLGMNHVRYGVKKEYYPVVKEAMLETIPEILGENYTDRIGMAWSQALDFIIETMIPKENKIVKVKDFSKAHKVVSKCPFHKISKLAFA